MIRGTSLAVALFNAANKVPDKLGIEHHIKYRLNETSAGLVREPDVFIHSEKYTGVYKSQAEKQANSNKSH